ncbi:MAG: hypothetical protein MUF31_12810 [Akkermansiaceae bacterium]|jgi:hypothetical protein|nr:hypothetical protein [Akkermansiaceae bacterium]
MKYVLFSLMALVSPAFAALTLVEVVDPFAVGTTPVSLRSGSVTAAQIESGIDFGGQRSVTVAVTSNPFLRDVRFGVIGQTGQFFVESGPRAAATVSIVYGSAAGLGGVDITVGGAANTLGIEFEDSDPAFQLTLRLTDVDGRVASGNAFRADAIAAGGVIEFGYAGLAGAELLDFTAIDRIELLMDNGPSGDFTANQVALYHAPEPGAPILAGLSAVLLAFRRKRSC